MISFMKEFLSLPVVIYFDEDTYIAKCPLIQGAFAEGDTPEEALKELMDVIRMIFEYRGSHPGFYPPIM